MGAFGAPLGSVGAPFGSKWALGGPLGLLRGTLWPQLEAQGRPKGGPGGPKRRFGNLLKTSIFLWFLMVFQPLGLPVGPKGAPGSTLEAPVRSKGVPGDAWGAALETLGSLWGARSGQSGRPVCQSYGNLRAPAGNQIKSKVKVYLTDKSYD